MSKEWINPWVFVNGKRRRKSTAEILAERQENQKTKTKPEPKPAKPARS